jgi:hypothetical protein
MATVSAKLIGGQKLSKVLAQISERAGGRSGAHVKVGYLAGATYPDGTPVAQNAFWQEFGTPGAQFPIPARPTFRTMIKQHMAEWGGQLARVLKGANYDRHTALGRMGELIKGELVDSLLHADVAPLSAVTLMLRKMRDENPGLRVSRATVFEAIRRVRAGEQGATGTRAKRLVNTGVLERAPDYEVVDGAQSP